MLQIRIRSIIDTRLDAQTVHKVTSECGQYAGRAARASLEGELSIKAVEKLRINEISQKPPKNMIFGCL